MNEPDLVPAPPALSAPDTPPADPAEQTSPAPLPEAIPEPLTEPQMESEIRDGEAAVPPDPGEAEEAPDVTDPKPARRIMPALSLLRLAVPWTLAGFAALIFAASAVAALSAADLTRERIGRFLIGSAFGGSDSVVSALPVPVDQPAEPAPSPDPPVPRTARGEDDEAERTTRTAETGPTAQEKSEADGTIDGIETEDPGVRTIRFTNETGYAPDPDALLAMPRAIPPLEELRGIWGEDAPLVLILHTHGTEAFSECAEGNYRSRDPALSVVSLGRRLADRLREVGIPTLHIETLFDSPDFNLAYYNAAAAIRDTLTLHPSVSYILDLHRDSMTFPDGTVFSPVTEIDSVKTAQLMFVVGTDEAGADHAGWRDNLALALRLQTALSGRYPTLMRDVNLRSASFNEQYAKGSLLIETGAAGCTLAEAEAAADLFADALIDEIRGEN